MNLPCGHLFCGSCVTLAWSKYYQAKERDGWLAQTQAIFECPYCRGQCGQIPRLNERKTESMPFTVDKGVNRIIEFIIEDGKHTAKRIVERLNREVGGLGENEGVVEGWKEGGQIDVERQQGYR